MHAGSGALRQLESENPSPTQRRQWVRRAVLWFEAVGKLWPGHPVVDDGLRRVQAAATGPPAKAAAAAAAPAAAAPAPAGS